MKLPIDYVQAKEREIKHIDEDIIDRQERIKLLSKEIRDLNHDKEAILYYLGQSDTVVIDGKTLPEVYGT